jgi:hypothetical protein
MELQKITLALLHLRRALTYHLPEMGDAASVVE